MSSNLVTNTIDAKRPADLKPRAESCLVAIHLMLRWQESHPGLRSLKYKAQERKPLRQIPPLCKQYITAKRSQTRCISSLHLQPLLHLREKLCTKNTSENKRSYAVSDNASLPSSKTSFGLAMATNSSTASCDASSRSRLVFSSKQRAI